MNDIELDQHRAAIAEEIKARRQYLKISQAELAERCGMKEDTIFRAEKALLWLNTKQMVILYHALGMERVEPLWRSI